MKSSLHEYGTFWFYGAVCVVGVLFVLTRVPETKVRGGVVSCHVQSSFLC